MPVTTAGRGWMLGIGPDSQRDKMLDCHFECFRKND